MLKNYFKIAWRNLLRNKIYSLINIWGLTVGLACSLLIFLYVHDEMSFDKFHENYENIHRLESRYTISENFRTTLDFPAGFAPLLKSEVQGIKNTVRYEPSRRVVISNDTEPVYEEGLVFVDPSFFEMFNFELEQGDKATALINPYSVIISKEIASKYFSNENPLGKNFILNKEDYLVTGVLSEIPHNTHFRFSMLSSFSTLNSEEKVWSSFPNYRTYVELEDRTSLETLKADIQAILVRNMGDTGSKYDTIITHPLTSIYLEVENYVYDTLRGNLEYVKMFLLIGLLILGIACINFMNLTTARASLRSKEIGIRKSSGAFKKQIVLQFLSESILFTLISGIFALVIMEIMLPSFNSVTGKELELNIFGSPIILLSIVSISILTGLLAGMYPAIFLSRFKPVSVLKGQFKTGKKAILFRKGLVVVQFIITIGLIVSTLIINNQLQYMQNRGLGINSEALVSIPVRNNINTQYSSFKNELLKNPDVVNVTTGSLLLGGISFETYSEDDDFENIPSGKTLQIYRTDYDFVNTLELNILAGRNLDPQILGDASLNILLNETSIKAFGWTTPTEALGEQISFSDKLYTVVGVVQDFHSISPTTSILPTAIATTDEGVDQVLIRLQTTDLSSAIASLKTVWNKFEPFLPFQISFMDDELTEQLRSEQNLRVLFSAFAFLTIFIACLGLLGLATFATEQRRKEIGVRKVLGASVQKILVLISKDFLILVGIGFMIASPITWYLMNEWIVNYPYRIDIGPQIFFIAGLSALTLSLITVSYHSMKAALANPVESLKNE
ncbi:MAG: ABC transporter permease [Balneolaceae bacterium]